MRYTFSLFIYRLLMLLLLPILLLALVVRSRNHPQYRQRLLERLGMGNKHFSAGGIVIHAASVGEVIALKTYIDKVLTAFTELPVTVTCFTPTGSAQIQKLFANRVQHCYLPLDVWPCTWLFLKALKPKALILMETELWPSLITQCAARGIGLQLINGRLSDKSMKSYRKLDWLIRPCLRRFDRIMTQSKDNQQNFLALGAEREKCQVSGNLKYDLAVSPEVLEKSQALAQFIDKTRSTWLVASTHPGDEELIIASFKQLLQHYPELLLILVPRHPERFQQVAQYCTEQGLNVTKRSAEQEVNAQDNVWLIDSLGELLALCRLADIVTMGGSFSSIGGHNPLEPALFKKPIIVGHDMTNFRQVMQQLTDAKGIKQLSTSYDSSALQISEQLADAVSELLQDPNEGLRLGQQAFNIVDINQGASDYSVNALKELLAEVQ